MYGKYKIIYSVFSSGQLTKNLEIFIKKGYNKDVLSHHGLPFLWTLSIKNWTQMNLIIFLIIMNATAFCLVVMKVIGKASGYKMNLEMIQKCFFLPPSPPCVFMHSYIYIFLLHFIYLYVFTFIYLYIYTHTWPLSSAHVYLL